MANIRKTVDPIRLVTDRWALADAHHQQNLFKWSELNTMYKLGSLYNLNARADERGRKTHPDQAIARVSSSILINAVKTIVPRLYGLFDPDGDWFNVVPQPMSRTTSQSSTYVNNKLTAQLDEEAYGEIYTGLTQTAKFGKSVFKLRWLVQDGKIYEDKPYMDVNSEGVPEIKWQRTSKNGVTFRGNKINLVPYWNFRIDPKSRTITGAEFTIEDIYMSVDELRAIAESDDLGVFEMDKVKKLVKDMDEKYGGSDPRSDDDKEYYGYDSHRRDIKAYDYWENERHFMIVNSPQGEQIQVLKKIDNPYWHQTKPYFDFSLEVDESTFYNQGAIEPLRDLHNIQSTALNQYLDANTMNLRPMRLIDTDLEVDIKRLTHYIPNDTIEVEGLAGRDIGKAIYEFKPELGSLLNAQLMFMNQTDTQAEKISGITEYITGSAGIGSNRTASGAALLTQNAEQRGSAPVALIGLGGMRMLKLMHSNNQQFSHPLEDLKGDYRFYVFGDARSNQMMQTQGLSMLAPLMIQAGADPKTVIKRLARAYKIPAVEELLPEDGTLEKNQATQMIQQAMAGQYDQGNQTPS